MADPEFFILKYSAWMDAARYERIMLGALVKNYADPIDVYHPRSAKESHLRYSATKPLQATFTDFVANVFATEKREGSVILNSLGGISFTGDTEEAAKFEGKLLRLKRLEQVDDFFDKVKEDQSVKERVPAWITLWNSNEVCMIVGILIMDDVEIDWTTTVHKDSRGNVKVPLDKIVIAATGAPNPLGDTGKAEAALSNDKKEGRVFKAKSGKSQIVAVQLRKVTKGYILNRGRLNMTKKGPAVEAGRSLDSELGDDEEALPDDELFLTKTM